MLKDYKQKTEPIDKLLDKGKISEALTKIDEMIKDNPYDDYLYYLKGLIYQSIGDNVSAEECFEKANEILKKKIGGLE